MADNTPKKVYKMFDRKTVGQSHIYLDQLPREANGIHNMDFDNNGRLVKRTGYTQHNTNSLSADHPITGLFRFYKVDTSTKFTLAICDTILYKLANSDPWGGTSIKTGLTSEANMYFAAFGNRCYMCNDEDGLFKFGVSTTAVRTVGITAPSAKPTGTAGGSGGSLGVGNYKFCYTYVDEDGYESNASPVSDAIDVGSAEVVTLTIVNSGDTKIASRNIYRTALAGAIYYYDGEVADNTTTTYESSGADTALGTQVKTKHDTSPTSPQLLVKRDNRIYLGDDEILYPSHISDVEYFPALWLQRTPDRRKIIGLVEQGRNLIVFTEDTISVLTGTDEDNFQFRKSFPGDGCIATKSIQNIKQYIIFLGFEGLMAFNGVETVDIDEKLNKYLRDNINYAYADTSCSCYYDDKYILSYPTNSSHALGASTVPNESVYFDYKTGKTGVYSFAFNVYSRWDKGDDGLSIKGGSTTIGRVYNLFTGLDDDTDPIECYDKVMPIDFGLPEVKKNFYDVYVKVKTTTGTSLRLYYTIDDEDETYKDATLTADKERWYRVRLPQSVNGRSIAIRPRMSDKYQAEFQGYIIVYDLEKLKV
jgi:hypothetical protein